MTAPASEGSPSGLREAPASATAGDLDASLLEVRDVSFAWKKGVGVLDRLSLSVAPGEHLALLGPNGSGKSTALSLAAGLFSPASGSVRWRFDGGAALTPLEARGRFGVVFQHPSLDQQLSARDNLVLAGHCAGLARARIAERVDTLLAAAGLAARADDRVKTFSGGMRRRLDLARALVAEPEALLLDEPTVGLDAEAFERFWQQLAAMRQGSRLTVVVATHRPEEAARCDRLVMIDRGRAVYDGTPEATVRALGQDVIALQAADAHEVAGTIQARLGLVARPTGPGETACEVPFGEDGGRLLVRVLELFPAGRVASIELRRPTLADAFVKLTGSRLADPAAQEAA